jgi:hypothetical protein
MGFEGSRIVELAWKVIDKNGAVFSSKCSWNFQKMKNFTTEIINMDTLLPSDLETIAMERGLCTRASMKKLQLIELLKPKPLTSLETEMVQRRRESRLPFKGSSLTVLKQQALEMDLPSSGTKTTLIDSLIDAGLSNMKESVYSKLDRDQTKVVDNWKAKEMIINAGPGSGKTTTLCALVVRVLQENPDARILVLAFNREAVSILTTRIRSASSDKIKGTILAPKSTARALIPKGRCGVRTFNEFARGILNNDSRSSSNISDDSSSFDKELAQASTSLLDRGAVWTWDWLIIDEGQDVQTKHVSLINAVHARTEHLVVAGDPRQELYPGAVWFSRIWAHEKKGTNYMVLSHNHRSHPRIVALLNAFSEDAFPLLHVEQIATREESPDGGVFLVNESLDDIGGASAIDSFISEAYGAGHAYVIGPVSVKKFQSEDVTCLLRQLIYENNQWPVKQIDGGGVSDLTDVCVIGTSKALKGTERQSVAVYRTDVPYEQYIDPTGVATKKAFYVALSRAKDRLLVVLGDQNYGKEVNENTAQSSLIKACGKGEEYKIKRKKPDTKFTILDLAVTDLSKLLKRNPCDFDDAPEFEPIVFDDTDAVVTDHDFRGNYVEAVLANNLGVDLMETFKKTKICNLSRVVKDGCVVKDGEALIAVPKALENLLENLLSSIREGFSGDIAFYSAQALFSFKIDREWTVSDNLENSLSQDLQSVKGAKECIVSMDSQIAKTKALEWGYQKPLTFQLTFHRSNREHPQYLVGILDICGLNSKHEIQSIIEVKHANQEPEHKKQVAIYSSIAGIKTTALINTKLGTSSVFEAYPLSYINDASRAILSLKLGSGCKSVRVRCNLFENHPIAVFVDVESYNDMVIEIGAIAVGSGDMQYVDHYHCIMKGLLPKPDSYDGNNSGWEGVANLVGLDLNESNVDSLKSTELVYEFKQWLLSLGIHESVLLVHWGGKDDKLLDCEEYTSHDLTGTFRNMLEKRKMRRAKVCGLSEASSMLLGPTFIFEPHRAYEDAIATAAIGAALLDLGGVC